MIKENIDSIRKRIAAACRRAPGRTGDVMLVAVSKGVPLALIREAALCGIDDFGESRVAQAAAKFREYRDFFQGLFAPPRWHMVGHLQTNKAKDCVRIFDLIHSVDSFRLAQAIDGAARASGKVIEVLVEVNVSGEASKHGVRPEETLELCRQLEPLSGVRLSGLMTIAPYSQNREDSRPCFRGLRELRDSISPKLAAPQGLPVLSMGMTDDFETAVEEGATMVRIGRGIFGTTPTGAVGEVR